MSKEEDWQGGEVVSNVIAGAIVYGTVWRARVYKGTDPVTKEPIHEDTVRVIPFNWDDIPNDLKKLWAGNIPVDNWKRVEKHNYYAIREKALGIIENTSICDTECDGRPGDDCYVIGFCIDERDDCFQKLYEAVVDHFKAYGDLRHTVLPPGRAREGDLEGD